MAKKAKSKVTKKPRVEEDDKGTNKMNLLVNASLAALAKLRSVEQASMRTFIFRDDHGGYVTALDEGHRLWKTLLKPKAAHPWGGPRRVWVLILLDKLIEHWEQCAQMFAVQFPDMASIAKAALEQTRQKLQANKSELDSIIPKLHYVVCHDKSKRLVRLVAGPGRLYPLTFPGAVRADDFVNMMLLPILSLEEMEEAPRTNLERQLQQFVKKKDKEDAVLAIEQ